MSLYKKPGCKNWIYRTSVNGKTWEASTGTPNKAEAQRRVPGLMALAQLQRDSIKECLTLKAAMLREGNLVTQDVGKEEAERVAIALKNFYAFVGAKDIPLIKINTDLLERYQRQRLQEVSLATYNMEVTYICRMLRRNRIIVEKPKPKKGTKTPNRPFTQEELKAFFSSCIYEHWVLFMTMLVTGARPAELIPSPRSNHKPLLKTEVDFQTGKTILRNAKLKINEPDRFRVLTIPEWLLEDLKAVADETQGPYLFNLRTHGIAPLFRRILERAGLDRLDTLGRKLTAHSLRHTFCDSLAASAGNNPFAVMKSMGHANLATTQKYCHGANEIISLEPILKSKPSKIRKACYTPEECVRRNQRLMTAKAAMGKDCGERGENGEREMTHI